MKIQSINVDKYLKVKNDSIFYKVPLDPYETVVATNEIMKMLNTNEESLRTRIVNLESNKTYQINRKTLDIAKLNGKS